MAHTRATVVNLVSQLSKHCVSRRSTSRPHFRRRFRWKTFGITIESTVLEFLPYERLAWDARGTGLDAYHAWLIQKTNQGSNVIIEKTQRGWVARLGKALKDQTVWSNIIKFGLKGYAKKLATVCRLHLRRTVLPTARAFLLFSTFRAKICCCRNPGFASWADFQQSWLTQGGTAEVAVVRERCHL
jgi:hypothetical protein